MQMKSIIAFVLGASIILGCANLKLKRGRSLVLSNGKKSSHLELLTFNELVGRVHIQTPDSDKAKTRIKRLPKGGFLRYKDTFIQKSKDVYPTLEANENGKPISLNCKSYSNQEYVPGMGDSKSMAAHIECDIIDTVQNKFEVFILEGKMDTIDKFIVYPDSTSENG